MCRHFPKWRVQLPTLMHLFLTVALSLAAPLTVSAQQLSGDELAGKKLFLQRCTVCHMPAPLQFDNPALPTYGPKLEGYVKDAGTESVAKAIIENGTARMPGFKYGLTSNEINQIVIYLKIFKLSDFIMPGAEVGGGPDVELDPDKQSGPAQPRGD